MVHAPQSREWFMAIPSWSPRQRRCAQGAGLAFLGVLVLGLSSLLWPRPASEAPPPLLPPTAASLTSGEWLRSFERYCKESAGVTRGLRAVNDLAMAALGLAPPWPEPRTRPMVAPNQFFYLAYSDHERLHRPWFDERGRVAVKLNRFAIRDREDLTEKKVPGETRVLCLGDSITMGWGVPEPASWPRQAEEVLRAALPSVRVVNTGAAGMACVDEYRIALEHHWSMFEPDAIVVATSINDLFPTNGLAVFRPESGPSGPVTRVSSSDPLALDPAVDWVAWLRGLDRPACEAAGLCGFDRPWDAMWDRGVPQASLLAIRDWCKVRGVRFVVALWPLLQGLGPGRTYPFTAMHTEVGAFCATNGITFVDLLPPLATVPQEETWVTPADMHPNPRAHALAALPIAAALLAQLR